MGNGEWGMYGGDKNGVLESAGHGAVYNLSPHITGCLIYGAPRRTDKGLVNWSQCRNGDLPQSPVVGTGVY